MKTSTSAPLYSALAKYLPFLIVACVFLLPLTMFDEPNVAVSIGGVLVAILGATGIITKQMKWEWADTLHRAVLIGLLSATTTLELTVFAFIALGVGMRPGQMLILLAAVIPALFFVENLTAGIGTVSLAAMAVFSYAVAYKKQVDEIDALAQHRRQQEEENTALTALLNEREGEKEDALIRYEQQTEVHAHVSSNLQSILSDFGEKFDKIRLNDLSCYVAPTDENEAKREFDEKFNGAVAGLRMTIMYIRFLIKETSRHINEIGSSTSTVSEQSRLQIEQIESISSAVAELMASFSEVAEQIHGTQVVAQNTVASIKRSNETVQDTIQDMHSIVAVVEETRTSLHQLETTTASIEDVTGTIQSIAEQTNLLALNAAIEAARSGEAGKGFAVVADEVRKLAERTRLATSQIGSTLKSIRNETNAAAKHVEQGTATARQSIERAENTKKSLHTIVEEVENLYRSIEVVGKAATNQVQAVEFIEANAQAITSFAEQTAQNIVSVDAEVDAVMVEMNNINGVADQFVFGERVERFNSYVGKTATLFAERCASIFTDAIKNNILTLDDIFDRDYKPLPRTNPQKYSTRYDAFCDRYILPIEEEYLASDSHFAFCILVDNNGYVPSHNVKFSQPLTGNQQIDLVSNRTKRIFNDATGLRAARNDKGVLLQTYRRDTGEFMNDVSAPVFIQGRHWGAVRIGFVFV